MFGTFDQFGETAQSVTRFLEPGAVHFEQDGRVALDDDGTFLLECFDAVIHDAVARLSRSLAVRVSDNNPLPASIAEIPKS